MGEIFLNIWIIWVLVEPNIFRINQSKLLLSSNFQDSNPSKVFARGDTKFDILTAVLRSTLKLPTGSATGPRKRRQRDYLGAATEPSSWSVEVGKVQITLTLPPIIMEVENGSL